ncbi:MAG: hypothetical protein IT562_04120 [Alphaproteobacteria bacterium]|nr:hypothetical protein [Alphaproteobacteria bacterium]
MRSDMAKIIVERPRRPGAKSKGRAGMRALDGPAVEGIRRPHRERKALNENLAPLTRFIGARVGQHWSKVYAEISANLRPSSTVQQHVRDHVGDIIAIKTAIRDGQIYVHRDSFVRGGPEPLGESFYRFFVHPVSGVILRNRHRARLAKPRA